MAGQIRAKDKSFDDGHNPQDVLISLGADKRIGLHSVPPFEKAGF